MLLRPKSSNDYNNSEIQLMCYWECILCSPECLLEPIEAKEDMSIVEEKGFSMGYEVEILIEGIA
jgi:hypothetical protein